MIFMGVLILTLGVNNTWRQYYTYHSAIDMVDTSSRAQKLNKDIVTATAFPPTRTPFQPSTLTPFQPQNDQGAAMLSSTKEHSGAILVTPSASPPPPLKPLSTGIGLVPDRLIIPIIDLDSPVIPIHYKEIEYNDQILEQWLVPNTFAAGWQDTSALLGSPGNTVLNGHHNAYGFVFKDLVKLELADNIEVYSGDHVFKYQVAAKMLFPERYRPLEERISNARWILPSTDERLTLITCWPADSNTGRIVIVAFPIH
jgi:LPXTG-site transpeptidase (sortase) family protein